MSKYIIDLNDKDKEVCEKYVNCELGDELSDYVNVTELAGAIANATPVTEGDLIMFRTLMTEIANKGLPFEEVLLLIDNAKTPCNPSGDCISREALKKHAIWTKVNNGVELIDIEVVPLVAIDNAPTVDLWQMRQEATENALKKAEVLYGRTQGSWEKDNIGIYCSVCKRHLDVETPFCPLCGADMKGGAK